MADSDKSLDIFIRTFYERTGFILAEADAKAMKAQFDDISKGSVPENMQGVFREVAESSRGGAAGMREFGEASIQTREKSELLRLGLHGVGAQFPELGLLARLFFNPMTAGLAVGVAGIEAYFHWQEKVEAKYHDLLNAAQKVNNDIREIFKSEKTADENFIEFNRAMAESAEHGRSLGDELKRDMEFADAMAQSADAAAKRFSDLHKDNADFQQKAIELMQATGQISAAQAEQMKLESEHAQKMQEFADAKAKAEGDVARKQSEINRVNEIVGNAGGDATTERNKQAADAQVTRLEKIIGDYVRDSKDNADARKKAEADLKTHSVDANAAAHDRSLIDEALQKQKVLDVAYQQAKLDLLVADQTKLQRDREWDDLQKAKDTLTQLTGELDKLKNTLSNLNADQKQQISAENLNYGMDSTIARVKAGGNLDDIFKGGINALQILQKLHDAGYSDSRITSEGEAAKKRRDAGGRLSPGESDAINREDMLHSAQQQVNASKELLAAMGWNAEQVMANFQSMVALHRAQGEINLSVKAELVALHARQRDFQTQLQNQRPTN